jgi:ADP-heptose:LPS heptosyltransferase
MRGDVLLTTPVLQRFKQLYPNAKLTLVTDFTEIVKSISFIDRVAEEIPNEHFDFIFNLKYELLPHFSIQQAYAKQVKINEYKESPPIIILTDSEKRGAKNILSECGIRLGDLIVSIHAGRKDDFVRKWNKSKWNRVIKYVTKRYNAKTLILGDGNEDKLSGGIDLRGKLDLRESMAVIANSHMFIGIDSFLIHIANAFKIPAIGLFGAIDPNKRIVPMENLICIFSNIHCKGCYHRLRPPVYGVKCKWREAKCMKSISVSMVTDAIDKLTEKIRK